MQARGSGGSAIPTFHMEAKKKNFNSSTFYHSIKVKELIHGNVKEVWTFWTSNRNAQFWSYHSRIKCWRQLSHLKINKSQKGCKKQIRQQHLCLYSDGSWDTNTALNRTAFAISAQAKYKYSLLNTVGILYQDEFFLFPSRRGFPRSEIWLSSWLDLLFYWGNMLRPPTLL